MSLIEAIEIIEEAMSCVLNESMPPMEDMDKISEAWDMVSEHFDKVKEGK